MPGASLGAHTAADAFIWVYDLYAILVGINCLHGTSSSAGGIIALTAAIGEIGPAIIGI